MSNTSGMVPSGRLLVLNDELRDLRKQYRSLKPASLFLLAAIFSAVVLFFVVHSTFSFVTLSAGGVAVVSALAGLWSMARSKRLRVEMEEIKQQIYDLDRQ